VMGPEGADTRAAKRQDCDGGEREPQKLQRAAAIRSSPLHFMHGDLAMTEKLRRLTPLVETADEVCAVARQLGASARDVLLGASATERAVKSASASGALEAYRIVHFATHALMASEAEIDAGGPAEPALVLTPPDIASQDDDGLLTSGEILQLKMNADWVVLSACNTAGGEHTGADALSGLARAFFYAGSRALLVSHWAVDSAATVKLITGTFGNVQARSELGRAQALRHAVLQMIAEGNEAAHPAYWAPFVVVGEGAAVSLVR
jgi:CHAT domain-containing protein